MGLFYRNRVAESFSYRGNNLGDIDFTAPPDGHGIFLSFHSIESLETLLKLEPTAELEISGDPEYEHLTCKEFKEKCYKRATAIYASKTPLTVFHNAWLQSKERKGEIKARILLGSTIS